MVLNVRERGPKIGVLRAIGFRARDVRTLVLSKACLLVVVGGLAGFALGMTVAILLDGPAQAGWAQGLRIALKQFGLAQGIGLAACVLGSWLPARATAALDPAEVLQEE
jgi:ABC-type lipoprotein release transport system permease subunit